MVELTISTKIPETEEDQEPEPAKGIALCEQVTLSETQAMIHQLIKNSKTLGRNL